MDQPQAPEEELPKESVVTVIPPATPSEGTEQKPEEQKPEDNVSAATTSDLVGMGYCSTAKAYSVTLNQLKALDDFEGYKVTYDIAPKAKMCIRDRDRPERRREQRHGFFRPIRGAGIKRAGAGGSAAAGCGGEKRE